MQANEAAWYDQHCQQIQTAEWVCWYKFSLPYLRSILNPQTKLVELGCGQGPLLQRMTRMLNALGQWRMSFHPILVFRKPLQSAPVPDGGGKKL